MSEVQRGRLREGNRKGDETQEVMLRNSCVGQLNVYSRFCILFITVYVFPQLIFMVYCFTVSNLVAYIEKAILVNSVGRCDMRDLVLL